LTFAIDAWLRKGILDLPEPYHPFGQPYGSAAQDGFDMSLLTTDTQPYAEVVDVVRARMGMVRDFLATASADLLAEQRPFVWDPQHQMPVLECLHVILNEAWEHHRYAVRDLDAIEAT
jgi:hypothetical protein